MKKQFVIGLLLLWNVFLAQDKKAYQIYTHSGQEAAYKDVLRAAEKAEVIFFGEEHDNAIAHWLELELTKDLSERRNIVLGAEMFEADNQKQLNQYLKGEINQKQLDTTARLWKNYKTDYKPLVEFAKQKQLPFIATNIPRKHASLVYKEGFAALESLPIEEKNYIAPLPIMYDATLFGYANMLKEMEGHRGENLPKAQAIKDATMAYFILKNLKKDAAFLHFNGSYHSNNFEGIVWYLKQKQPKLKIQTIALVTQADIARLDKEHINKADFIIVVDQDVTKTY